MGNFNETRVKNALIEMKQDGIITDFTSHVEEPERRLVIGQTTLSKQDIANANNKLISRETNLENDRLKIDILIHKQVDGQMVYCPLQVKSESCKAHRNCQLLLSWQQIDRLKKLLLDNFPQITMKKALGKNVFLLPIHYGYAVIFRAASMSKSAIKTYISKILDSPSETFQSVVKLPQLKGFELLKSLIESKLLTIGHKSQPSEVK